MTRIGLVLGGGGSAGTAYLAGALTALEHDLGWDPRDAEVIVGTSAGSLIGALLRLGVPAGDLAAFSVEAPHAAHHPLVAEEVIQRPELPPINPAQFLRPLRLPGMAMMRRWVRRPWAASPLAALAALVPAGQVELAPHLAFVAEQLPGGAWPDGELWVCALRERNLRRVVFGRDPVDAPLDAAVAASCAVPGYFSPVEIGGERFVDGGVHSSTNSDVLIGRADLDLVIVLAPMGATEASGLGPSPALRRHVNRQLRSERHRLEAAGLPAAVFAPGPKVTRHVGLDMLKADRLTEIVRDSFLDTGAQLLEHPRRGQLLRALLVQP